MLGFDPQQIKLIFFDIDDTLYMKNAKCLPESIPLVMEKLKQKGIIPAIATGRALCAFPAEIDELIAQYNIELFVTLNGQYNRYQRQVISHYPIATQKIVELLDILKKHQINYSFVSDTVVTVSEISQEVTSSLDAITTKYYINHDYYLSHDVYQLLVYYDEALREREEIHSYLANNGLKEIRWHQHAVDVLNQDCSKARGIRDVLQALDIDMQQTMAFGDGLNDFEMLNAVGVGVAMGNGHSELQAQADYVAPNIDDDGIYHFLKKYHVID